jgi:hypothetical protein
MGYSYPIKARYVGGYMLEVHFEDGKSGSLDFSEFITPGTVFEKLRDLSFFKQFYIDSSTGVLAWPGRIDIAPETLYHKTTGEPLPDWMEE